MGSSAFFVFLVLGFRVYGYTVLGFRVDLEPKATFLGFPIMIALCKSKNMCRFYRVFTHSL